MSSSAEQTDALLDWQPGPPRAARADVLGALRWGVCRAWNAKLTIGYLWLAYFLIVERAARSVLEALRSSATWSGVTDSVLQSVTAGSILGTVTTADSISGAATATGLRSLVIAALERPIWSPEAYFILFYGVLAGGAIAYLHAPRPAPVLAQLAANSGVYVGRFVRLLVVAAFLWWALAELAGRLFAGGATGALVWLQIIALQLSVTLLALTIDYARVRTVARDSRSMLMETWRSLRFVFANLARTLLLHVLLLTLGALVTVAFFALAAILRGLLPPLAAAFIGEQLFVLALLWVRLAMWGAELSLYQGLTAAALSKGAEASE